MIINIPLKIDDDLWENALAKDYEAKVVDRLTEEVRRCLAKHDSFSYSLTQSSVSRGLSNWVGAKLDDILKEYKAEIIEAAADKLAERLARTKAAKGVVANTKGEAK